MDASVTLVVTLFGFNEFQYQHQNGITWIVYLQMVNFWHAYTFVVDKYLSIQIWEWFYWWQLQLIIVEAFLGHEKAEKYHELQSVKNKLCVCVCVCVEASLFVKPLRFFQYFQSIPISKAWCFVCVYMFVWCVYACTCVSVWVCVRSLLCVGISLGFYPKWIPISKACCVHACVCVCMAEGFTLCFSPAP